MSNFKRFNASEHDNYYTNAVLPTGTLTWDDSTGLRLHDGTTEGGNTVGGGSTGLVTFDGVQVIGAGTASGDGAGYATLELVPDATLYNNDQYLVIDPTAPSHIHIRAGGDQDASGAELFLGGERNNVKVSDGGDYVSITTDAGESGTNNWQFGADGTLTFPDGGSLRVGPAPSSSAGAVGDTAGTVAYDSNYIYYCVQDHGGGQNTFVTTVADGGLGVDTIPVVKGSYGTPTTAWTVTFLTVDYAITNVTDGGASWVLTTPGQLASGGDGISVGLFNGVTGNDIWVKQAWGTTGTW
jgi:hypothetical protein